MQISYLNCDGKKKLFSFTTHDFRKEEIDGVVYMIDGGVSAYSSGYGRYSTSGTVEKAEVKDLIEEIRQEFTWGKNYNEDGSRLEKTKYALLKDLSSSHICGILSYFNNNAFRVIEMNEEHDKEVGVPVTKQWLIFHEVFVQELSYRIRNSIL